MAEGDFPEPAPGGPIPREDTDPSEFPRLLEDLGRDLVQLLGALRRPLPAAFLEHVARTPPWSEDRRVAAALVQNPRTPVHVGMQLVAALYWRDLAAATVNPWIAATLRVRAEALLVEQLRDLRLGEKVALARMAAGNVLRLLLGESDARVLAGALWSPRLQESQLAQFLRGEGATRALIEAVAASPRWRAVYAVRVELVLQRRTPVAIALAQLSSLLPADLRRVAHAPGPAPVVRAAAERLLEADRERKPRR
jgi:hypothetical protein